MSLSAFKAQMTARATRRFTDRDEPKAVFQTQIARLKANYNYFSVTMFYGVGGIGKSSLLRYLYDNTDAQIFSRTFVDIDAALYSSPIDILLDFHRQLPFSCPIFEYAVAKYFSTLGRDIRQINRSLVRTDSILFDLQEFATDLAEVVAPLRLLTRLAEMGYERARRLLPGIRPEIARIDELKSVEELEERLPAYLGVEIERNLNSNPRRLVFFIDSYDATVRRDMFQGAKRGSDHWLMEFVGAAEKSLFVIAGRERLRWDDLNASWSSVLDQHILGRLSDADADDFLLKIPVTEEGVRNVMVSSAKGVPLYLDLCAQTYLQKKSRKESISERDFDITEDKVIDRFLAHLSSDQAEALRAVSIPEIFDQRYFASILQSLGIGYPHTKFTEFCDGSYCTELRVNGGIYKIHDIVRDYLFDEADDYTTTTVAEATLGSLEQGIVEQDHTRGCWVFDQLLGILSRRRRSPSPAHHARILHCGLWLVDTGHWVEVERSISRLRSSDFVKEDFELVLVYLSAYCARKSGRLRQANELYRRIEEQAYRLGQYGYLLRYHSAHVVHLLGNFAQAEQKYADLLGVKPEGEVHREAYMLAKRQLTDVEMIRGRFRSALESFEKLKSAYTDPLWHAEVLRFQGHVYRFNADFKQAEIVYNKARDLALGMKADGMLGKTLTNLSETLCWLFPATALDIIEKALDLNTQIQAPIEIGKVLAAKAIALCMNGHLEDALNVAREAAMIQAENGYRNGLLFALQAEGLAWHFQENQTEVKRVIQKMNKISSEVTVYEFLSLILKAAVGTPNLTEEYGRFDWLDMNSVMDNHRLLIRVPSSPRE